ncbi:MULTISPECIES: TMEM14 family protein [Aerosakkonema]|uniref:TMEM14 family protein n=1 Tax=Aerosakkonema funiforme FACHB-1375 TaxID=2949571 RepID=A0A926VJX7_9CYAN|nr:TMEM14 family protein [Aerosakkonema funiforme]MBD2185176.1 TMEM14 family protein [Aerosakkonema funiforme FACHB-1375]
MDLIAVWSILVYALAVALGGIFGYLKAKSKMSLISGLLSGAALLAAWFLALQQAQIGLAIATSIGAVLVVIFIARLVRTRKFMPAGLMMSLSFVATLVFLWGWLAIA